MVASRRAGGGTTVPVLVAPEGVFAQSEWIVRYADRQLEPEQRLFTGDPEVEALSRRLDAGLGPDGRRADLRAHAAAPGVDAARTTTGRAGLGGRALSVLYALAVPLGAASSPSDTTRDAGRCSRSSTRSPSGCGTAPYLCGERFTAADLTFACLAAAVVLPPEYGVRLPQPDELPEPVATTSEHSARTPPAPTRCAVPRARYRQQPPESSREARAGASASSRSSRSPCARRRAAIARSSASASSGRAARIGSYWRGRTRRRARRRPPGPWRARRARQQRHLAQHAPAGRVPRLHLGAVVAAQEHLDRRLRRPRTASRPPGPGRSSAPSGRTSAGARCARARRARPGLRTRTAPCRRAASPGPRAAAVVGRELRADLQRLARVVAVAACSSATRDGWFMCASSRLTWRGTHSSPVWSIRSRSRAQSATWFIDARYWLQADANSPSWSPSSARQRARHAQRPLEAEVPAAVPEHEAPHLGRQR